VLRPGNLTAAKGAVAILQRLVKMIRRHIPGIQIRVRLDGGFAHPAVFEFLDAQPKLEYVVAMAKNAVLNGVAKTGMWRPRQLSRRSGKTEHIYGESRYKAGKWPGRRRVIIKAEVVCAADKEPKDNPRLVITNMKQSPQWIYENVYCQRGDIENRTKQLHELEIDRTSCTCFWANQFRVLLAAAAYVLMQELRLRAAGTACARAQVGTLRERLLKVGARVFGFCTTCRCPSSGFLPVLTGFPTSSTGAQRDHRLNPLRSLRTRLKSRLATVTAPLSLHLANWTVRITELCVSLILSLDQTQSPGFISQLAPSLSFVITFTNNAGLARWS
jgi:hypothetical protein